ncbi:hypothetical protein [Egbenema bharatensis]|uniref:hypothetical protein n=1 Tax=Egbenema bharatensis TaxID=3463334 RepID=UPI003A842A32
MHWWITLVLVGAAYWLGRLQGELVATYRIRRKLERILMEVVLVQRYQEAIDQEQQLN